MSSSSSSKAPCATCDGKGVGIFKCEGCSQVFCRKHVIDHRDMLSQQLDGITVEHDTLLQTIAENKREQFRQHPLMVKINEWEAESIEKIKQMAKETRRQIEKLIGTEKDTILTDVHALTQRLQTARSDDDFVETDLRTWKNVLDKLKVDLTVASSLISIREDPTNTLIGKMVITSASSEIVENEMLVSGSKDVRITNKGRVAIHVGERRVNTYVHGTREYSTGRHKIRFGMSKRSSEFVISFNIVSKLMFTTQPTINGDCLTYGWCSNDCTNGSSSRPSVRDLRGEITFEIELLLDCDNQKISYSNIRTRHIREMDVDITKCPFPWQLRFYLYDIGDQVQLLPVQVN